MDTLNREYGQVRFFVNHPWGAGWPEYAEINVDPEAVRYSEAASELNVRIDIDNDQWKYNAAGLLWLEKEILGQPLIRKGLMLISVSQWKSDRRWHFQGFPNASYRKELKFDVITLNVVSVGLSEFKFHDIKDSAASGRKWRHVQVA